MRRDTGVLDLRILAFGVANGCVCIWEHSHSVTDSDRSGILAFGVANGCVRICAHSHSVTDSDRSGGVWQLGRSGDNNLNTVRIFGAL